MADEGRHDDRLLDALEEVGRTPYEGEMWRVVRAGRSPLDGSRGSGRWNPSRLSVLYGAQEANGALAEIHYHISRAEPIFPSKMQHSLVKMRVNIGETLTLANMDALVQLGVEVERYKEMLYQRTQEIAAAAAYMDFDGIIAPSARWKCNNVILFLDKLGDIDDAIEEVQSTPIDWKAWRTENVL